MKTIARLHGRTLAEFPDDLKQVRLGQNFWVNQQEFVVRTISLDGDARIIDLRLVGDTDEAEALGILFSLRPNGWYRIKRVETDIEKARALRQWIAVRLLKRPLTTGQHKAMEAWANEFVKQEKAPFASAIGMLRDAGAIYIDHLRNQRDELESEIHDLQEKLSDAASMLRLAKSQVMPSTMGEIDAVLERIK